MKLRLYILFLLVSPFAWSQTRSHIAQPTFQIGEQPEVVYELELASEKDRVRFEPKMGLIPCDPLDKNSALKTGDKVNIEIIGEFEESISPGKPLKWIGKYKVTAWDTGYFEIPAPSIVLNDSMVNFQPIRFKVIAPAKIDGQGIYETEVKFLDIEEDPFYWLKHNAWWMALLLVLGIAFLLFRRFRKKLPPPETKETSLKERTLTAIDALDASRLWEKGRLKEHYIEMSYILRAYLGARYGLNLLERTSHQTTLLLIAQGLSQDTVQTIQRILDQADLVKFAKSAPAEMEIYKISALAKQIVAETSPIEFDV